MIDLQCRRGDLSITLDDLTQEDTLETAVMLSLYTDRRDDESGDRGWWGDCVADHVGDRFGSRLWLLDRAKRSAQTLTLVEEYAREATAWLVEDKAAQSVTVSAQYLTADASAVGLTVTIVDPVGLTRVYNFARASGTWL